LIQASPLSAVLFRECLGLSDEAAIRADHEWSSWLNTKTRSVQPGISPHAPYSVGRKLLEQVHARRGPLAIHFAEFPDETELLESGRGLLRDFLESLGVWNEAALFNSHREILNHLTSTGPKLLVHANHLDPQIPLPPDSSIVYCPRTHAAFGHAPHPFRELLAAGHRVVLGTDSLASNPDLDVLREAAFLHQQHPDFPSEKLLRMVTLDAAEAIHDRRFGTIEIGSPVDLVLLPITGSASDPYSLLWDAARSEEGRERIMDNR
jgi:cytosine/adenosine deaminase-related metal-dependent hydrolase